jgi:hypothetical protein
MSATDYKEAVRSCSSAPEEDNHEDEAEAKEEAVINRQENEEDEA